MKSEGGHKNLKNLKVSSYAVQSRILYLEVDFPLVVTFDWLDTRGGRAPRWTRLRSAVILRCGTASYPKGVRSYGRRKSASYISRYGVCDHD